jgi:hypothetical protein
MKAMPAYLIGTLVGATSVKLCFLSWDISFIILGVYVVCLLKEKKTDWFKKIKR